MKKSMTRIGEILIKKGMITEAQLHDALLSQKINAGFLGTILVNKGLLASKQLAEALSEQFDIPLVDLNIQYVDMNVSGKFSSSVILDHKCFPLREDDNSIVVAITNPLNAVAVAKVEEEAHPKTVKWVMVTEDDLNAAIKNYRQGITRNIQKLLRKDKR